MLTGAEWGLVYLCWIIALGSLLATAFTLRRFFEMRRQHQAAQGIGPSPLGFEPFRHGEAETHDFLARSVAVGVALVAAGTLGAILAGGYGVATGKYMLAVVSVWSLIGPGLGALVTHYFERGKNAPRDAERGQENRTD